MKPSTLYRIGVWLRGGATNSSDELTVVISAALYQANGQPASTPQTRFYASTSAAPDQWKPLQKVGLYPYSSTFPTPPDTAYCNLNIFLYGGDAQRQRTAVGTVYLDDVEVVELRPEDRVPPVQVVAGAVETAKGGTP